MLFVAMKKAYLIDFIGFIIAKTKNISHVFSMTYVASGNRCKIYDPQGTIIWSDVTALIGKNFRDYSIFTGFWYGSRKAFVL